MSLRSVWNNASVVPGARSLVVSADSHSAATDSAQSMVAGSCGTKPTLATNSFPDSSTGSMPRTCTVPESGDWLPAKERNKVVFPAPLRPITATISPALTCRSIDRSTGAPLRTTASLATCATVGPGSATAGSGGIGGKLCRRSAAARRASRVDNGSGSHPTRLPSVANGGSTGETDMASLGSVCRLTVPSPWTMSTVSAYCTTRSSRCSETTTVRPRS